MTDTKTCTRCGEEKPLELFGSAPQTPSGRHAWCKTCLAASAKRRRDGDPEASRQREATRRAGFRAWMDELKDGPCVDCGGRHPPYVMQWDHRDPTEKSFTIGGTDRPTIRRDVILMEIAKCDLVCANCHLERTHGPLKRNGLPDSRY